MESLGNIWSQSSTKFLSVVIVVWVHFLAYVTSRYLEQCLFQQVQKIINSIKERTDDEKLTNEIALMLRILEVENEPQELDQDGDLTPALAAAMDGLLDRRKRVRAALWAYCNIKASQLKTFANIWEKCHLYRHHISGKRICERFQNDLDSFDKVLRSTPDEKDNDVPMHSTGPIFKLAPHPDTLPVPDDKTQSTVHFPSAVPIATMLARLDGLCLAARFQLPGNNCRELQEQLSSRIFLALLNLRWSSDRNLGIDLDNIPRVANAAKSCPPNLIFMNYILAEFVRRKELMAIHHLAMYTGFETVNRFRTKEHREMLHASRRWVELTEMFGEAIILCGSPFVDGLLPWNIHIITDEGSDEEFEKLKSELLPHYEWMRATVRKMDGVARRVEIILESMAEDTSVHENFIEKTVRESVGYCDPASVIGFLGMDADYRLPAILATLHEHSLTTSTEKTLLFIEYIEQIRRLLLESSSENAPSASELVKTWVAAIYRFGDEHPEPQRTTYEYFTRKLLSFLM